MSKQSCRVYCALLAAGIFFFSGCRKSSETNATATLQAENAQAQAAPTPAPTAPASKERHHRIFMNEVSPLIVSMSPDTIVVHDGHAPMQRFSLTYEIDHAEKATKAYISIYARGIGEVQRFDVDVQPRAQIEFLLDASSFDLGPTVRFRAHCPYGDTDWYVMGSDPPEFPQRPSSKEIGLVGPAYIDKRSLAPGVEVSISIDGAQFTRDCTAEAQVDGTTVELRNVVAGDRRITAQLPADALQRRPVAVRHFEVQLVVYGPGMPAEDVYELTFAE